MKGGVTALFFEISGLFLSGSLEPFGVFRNLQLVEHILDVSVHKHRPIVHSVIDAVVRNSRLRIIVGADFCRTVSSR